MRISVGEGTIGELFFSLPLLEELALAEEQISSYCRNALQQNENSRLEYELEQMKKTKTAFHFLVLKEICSLSKEEGYQIILKGNIAGSIISSLLGISPINPNEDYCISSELIWETHKDYYTPVFEIGISEQIRSLIQERLDEKFGFVKSNDTLYYKIRMTDTNLCDEVGNTDIKIKNFDTDICTKVLHKLYPEYNKITCNFEQLITLYAYQSGSFSNDICLEKLFDDNIIVTRDKLYFALISNEVPKEIAIEVVKKGMWSSETKKGEYLLLLEKYSLPEFVISSFTNTKHLWNTASCISRLCLLCQKEYHLKYGI